MSAPPSFLASGYPNAPADRARFQVIPAPMELSVSYGRGAARGPRAILEASQQLEDYDGRTCPGDSGIHTRPAVRPLSGRGPLAGRWLQAIESAVARALRAGAVPILLGGEHTVTLGAARALSAAGRSVGFIQFDAHADLRDEYEGSPYSHACVMRRVHELGFPLLQIATRAFCLEERDYRRRHRRTITAYDADRLAAGPLPRPWIPRDFPKEVYVTFDVDAFDPAIMPATGTPVPGGLFWHPAMRLLDDIASRGRIVGADVVELAPVRGWHHADFTAARLVYALMGAAGCCGKAAVLAAAVRRQRRRP